MLEDETVFSRTSVNIRNYSSLAALVFLVIEHLTTCKDEYKYIWRPATFKTAPSSIIGILYLWARYVSLCTLTVHYAFVHKFLARAPVSSQHCRTWFLFLLLSLSSLMVVLDAVLFLRVYALYSKSKNILLLIVPIILQFVIASILTWDISQKGAFNYQCDFRNPPIESIFLGVSVIVTHASLWVATFAKRNVGQGQALIVKLVVREGSWTFVLLFAIVSGLLPYVYASHTANPFIVFVWPISVISITAYHDMRRLGPEPSPNDILMLTDDFRLSTVDTFPGDDMLHQYTSEEPERKTSNDC
ncbi:hypothetical protein BDZ97DRAFT_2061256 [Flammula alnicola]|nr:hypothetical protein BDZ97DRAFT_2061256 [Flammula alnicola]